VLNVSTGDPESRWEEVEMTSLVEFRENMLRLRLYLNLSAHCRRNHIRITGFRYATSGDDAFNASSLGTTLPQVRLLCGRDIGRPPVAGRIIRSDEYQRQLHDPKYPALANSFLCWALVELSACGHVTLGVSGTDSTEEQPDLFPLAETARVARAAWALIYAAWACDDSDGRSGRR